jgi:hypothetical protein
MGDENTQFIFPPKYLLMFIGNVLTHALNGSLAAVVVFYRRQFWAFVGKRSPKQPQNDHWG